MERERDRETANRCNPRAGTGDGADDDQDNAARHFIADEWYAILESRRLRKRPVTVERMGRRLVLWRDGEGRPVAQDARCPHRGADLGLGRVVDGTLECRYHGFRFAADGQCTRVPCEGRDYRPSAGLRVARYPVVERHGLIWLWWSQDEAAVDLDALPPVPWWDELPDNLARSYTRTMEWVCPMPRVAEGMLDLYHVPFAHRGVMPFAGERLDPYTVEVDGPVIRTHGVLRADDGKPWSGKGGFAFGLTVRFPGLILGGLGDSTTFVGAFTPIDDERTWIVYRYYSRVPVLGRFLAWFMTWIEDYLVQPDDQRLQESSTPRHFETRDHHYVPSDRGMLQWHKMYRARMEKQLAAHRPRLPVVADSEPGSRPSAMAS